jgi:transposase
MSEITRVGIDLAKNVLQVHAVDAAGKIVAARSVERKKFAAWCVQLPAGCLVAMEACAGSHNWARKLAGLDLQVRLIAPHLVTPYRMQGKSGKNDANDAAAICEAASRPSMRFVPIKTVHQQGLLAVHRMREAYKTDRSACINRIRAMLAEFGLVAPISPGALHKAMPDLLEDASNDLPGVVRLLVQAEIEHWAHFDERLKWCDQRIAAHVEQDEGAKQATQLWGVGIVTASAMVATVCDFKQFTNAAQFSAWLGLTPSQSSSGGKSKLGGITKRGDMYLRTLLVQGARSALLTGKRRDDRIASRARELSLRKGWQKAAVALASKNARILWAMFTRGSTFDASHVSIKPA